MRVTNTNTLCYNANTSFNIVVSELPEIINPIVTVEQCDSDDDNNGITNFNLTEYQSLISTNYALMKILNFILMRKEQN